QLPPASDTEEILFRQLALVAVGVGYRHVYLQVSGGSSGDASPPTWQSRRRRVLTGLPFHDADVPRLPGWIRPPSIFYEENYPCSVLRLIKIVFTDFAQ